MYLSLKRESDFWEKVNFCSYCKSSVIICFREQKCSPLSLRNPLLKNQKQAEAWHFSSDEIPAKTQKRWWMIGNTWGDLQKHVFLWNPDNFRKVPILMDFDDHDLGFPMVIILSPVMAEDFRMMPMSSRVAQGDTAVLKCLAPRWWWWWWRWC